MSDRDPAVPPQDGHSLTRDDTRPGSMWASMVSAGCLLRGLPLFFCATPRTPLRVLGIVALDTLHVLRHSRPLPRKRIGELAMFLDLEGCTNAAWDHKDMCEAHYRSLRQRLEKAGLRSCLEEYLSLLRELEGRRPSIGGDRRRFDEVRAYREGVARLSIATAAAIALNRKCRAKDIHPACCDSDVDALFRILMQCQIIDDVVDYAEDLSSGLPSFLTASASLSQSVALTAEAARQYAAGGGPATGAGAFPLRVALSVVTVVAKLVISVAGRRHRNARWFDITTVRAKS